MGTRSALRSERQIQQVLDAGRVTESDMQVGATVWWDFKMPVHPGLVAKVLGTVFREVCYHVRSMALLLLMCLHMLLMSCCNVGVLVLRTDALPVGRCFLPRG